ncbi:hypothetical protein PAPYR_4456 [Paratrimastix pyriformis]|uniref:TOG domain-containing protein n=1 Tax=Paratrimastix pyriformis TaxID=342808 RepID=A0ABQ8UMK6_9EUKA|nr:hypothetical protein PAPYR_4456 [Paratrimastix pyriformis]
MAQKPTATPPAPRDPPPYDVFDLNTVKNLLACVDDSDPDFFKNLYQTFLDHTQKSLDQIDALRRVDNHIEITKITVCLHFMHFFTFYHVPMQHSLKGSTGSVGAMQLSTILAEMNVLGKAQRYQEAIALWPQVLDEWNRVKNAVPLILANPPMDDDESGSYTGSESGSGSYSGSEDEEEEEIPQRARAAPTVQQRVPVPQQMQQRVPVPQQPMTQPHTPVPQQVQQRAAPLPHPIRFGFCPDSIISGLRQTADWKLRATALKQLLKAVTAISEVDSVVPFLSEFISFMTPFLDDNNVQVSGTAFEIFYHTSDKFGMNLKSLLPILVPTLVEKLGDNKVLVRRADMRVLYKLMAVCGPTEVIPHLLPYLRHTSSHIRLEVTHAMIIAYLLPDVIPYSNTNALVAALDPLLSDPSTKVRTLALEAYAVAYAALGTQLDRARTQRDPAQTALIQARLTDPVLPRLGPEGTVEHVRPLVPPAAPTPPAPGASPTSFSPATLATPTPTPTQSISPAFTPSPALGTPVTPLKLGGASTADGAFFHRTAQPLLPELPAGSQRGDRATPGQPPRPDPLPALSQRKSSAGLRPARSAHPVLCPRSGNPRVSALVKQTVRPSHAVCLGMVVVVPFRLPWDIPEPPPMPPSSVRGAPASHRAEDADGDPLESSLAIPPSARPNRKEATPFELQPSSATLTPTLPTSGTPVAPGPPPRPRRHSVAGVTTPFGLGTASELTSTPDAFRAMAEAYGRTPSHLSYMGSGLPPVPPTPTAAAAAAAAPDRSDESAPPVLSTTPALSAWRATLAPLGPSPAAGPPVSRLSGAGAPAAATAPGSSDSLGAARSSSDSFATARVPPSPFSARHPAGGSSAASSSDSLGRTGARPSSDTLSSASGPGSATGLLLPSTTAGASGDSFLLSPGPPRGNAFGSPGSFDMAPLSSASPAIASHRERDAASLPGASVVLTSVASFTPPGGHATGPTSTPTSSPATSSSTPGPATGAAALTSPAAPQGFGFGSAGTSPGPELAGPPGSTAASAARNPWAPTRSSSHELAPSAMRLLPPASAGPSMSPNPGSEQSAPSQEGTSPVRELNLFADGAFSGTSALAHSSSGGGGGVISPLNPGSSTAALSSPLAPAVAAEVLVSARGASLGGRPAPIQVSPPPEQAGSSHHVSLPPELPAAATRQRSSFAPPASFRVGPRSDSSASRTRGRHPPDLAGDALRDLVIDGTNPPLSARSHSSGELASPTALHPNAFGPSSPPPLTPPPPSSPRQLRSPPRFSPPASPQPAAPAPGLSSTYPPILPGLPAARPSGRGNPAALGLQGPPGDAPADTAASGEAMPVGRPAPLVARLQPARHKPAPAPPAFTTPAVAAARMEAAVPVVEERANPAVLPAEVPTTPQAGPPPGRMRLLHPRAGSARGAVIPMNHSLAQPSAEGAALTPLEFPLPASAPPSALLPMAAARRAHQSGGGGGGGAMGSAPRAEGALTPGGGGAAGLGWSRAEKPRMGLGAGLGMLPQSAPAASGSGIGGGSGATIGGVGVGVGMGMGDLLPADDEAANFPSYLAVRLSRSPEAELKAALEKQGKDTHWQVLSNSTDMVRYLTANYREVVLANSAAVVSFVHGVVENLRSNLSKNALSCLAELYTALGRALDPHIEASLQILVRKMGEASRFIEAEADGVMAALVVNATTAKVLARMLPYISHKSAVVRAKMHRFIALGLTALVRPPATAPPHPLLGSLATLGSSRGDAGLSAYREPGPLVAAILRGVSDPSPDAREYARSAAQQVGILVARQGGSLDGWLARHLASPDHVQTFIRAAAEGRAGAPAHPAASPTQRPPAPRILSAQQQAAAPVPRALGSRPVTVTAPPGDLAVPPPTTSPRLRAGTPPEVATPPEAGSPMSPASASASGVPSTPSISHTPRRGMLIRPGQTSPAVAKPLTALGGLRMTPGKPLPVPPHVGASLSLSTAGPGVSGQQQPPKSSGGLAAPAPGGGLRSPALSVEEESGPHCKIRGRSPSPAPVEDPLAIVAALHATDWQRRLAALAQALTHLTRHPGDHCLDVSAALSGPEAAAPEDTPREGSRDPRAPPATLFGQLLACVADHHNAVALAALNALTVAAPALKTAIEGSLDGLLGALTTAMASPDPDVGTQAVRLLDVLVPGPPGAPLLVAPGPASGPLAAPLRLEAGPTLRALAGAVTFDCPPPARAPLLQKMALLAVQLRLELPPGAPAGSPATVQQAFAVGVRLFDDGTVPDIRQAAVGLLKALRLYMGPAAFGELLGGLNSLKRIRILAEVAPAAPAPPGASAAGLKRVTEIFMEHNTSHPPRSDPPEQHHQPHPKTQHRKGAQEPQEAQPRGRLAAPPQHTER